MVDNCYVVVDPHQDPAHVVAGPTDPDHAKTIATFEPGGTVKVLHAALLAYEVSENGYSVKWYDSVEKPASLRKGADRQERGAA